MNYFNKLIAISFVFTICTFSTGCSKRSSNEAGDSTPPVAVVNGEIISSKDFQDKALKLENQMGINMDVYQEREKLLQQLIAMTLLYQKAKEENFEKSTDYKEYLALAYLKSKIPDSEVSDDEINKYYAQNKDKLEEVRVAHILIKPAKPGDAASDKEAHQKAANILIRALNGEDFAKLAAENSQDEANAKAGGDLGFFKRGMMVKEFEEAAFSLKKPNDLSKVIKTQYGYHILKLLDSKRGLETFRDDIKRELRLSKERNLFVSLVEDLKKKADVKTYDDNLKNVKIINENILLK